MCPKLEGGLNTPRWKIGRRCGSLSRSWSICHGTVAKKRRRDKATKQPRKKELKDKRTSLLGMIIGSVGVCERWLLPLYHVD